MYIFRDSSSHRAAPSQAWGPGSADLDDGVQVKPVCVNMGRRQTYHQISSSCDLCMCVLGIDNNELGFVFLPRHQTLHRLRERNVLTREPPSVFLDLFLPTPGPNHNHQDGYLQTCNSLYFCRQPNLHSTQARHDQELFRPPAPFPLMKMAIHLPKMKAISVYKRKAKLVQNHQPGHVIADTASSFSSPDIRGPDKPPSWTVSKRQGPGPEVSTLSPPPLPSQDAGSTLLNCITVTFCVPNNAPRTPAPQSFPPAVRTPRTAPLFCPACACFACQDSHSARGKDVEHQEGNPFPGVILASTRHVASG